MSQLELCTSSFPAELMSARRARQLVEEQISAWGLEAVREAAALCAAELAANAVLHTRQPFTLTVRRTGHGARIDVVDRVPDQLPLIAPVAGSAADILRSGLTGRGLQLVAAVATRWGAFTAGPAKTVWVELDTSGPPAVPTDGVFEDNRTLPVSATARTVHYLDLPVRAAVASGVQLEEAVRHVQLRGERAKPLLAPTSTDTLFSLLDRSAPVRLAGRHAAFIASGADQARFDLDLTADADAFDALTELAPLLARMAGGTPLASLMAGVAELREWLSAEARRQADGASPRPCALPE